MASEDDIKKTALLARIQTTPEELEQLITDVQKILTYVEELNEVNVENAEPMSHVHGSTNIFRNDVSKSTMTPEEGLSNAPDRRDTFFRVPLIIGQED